MACHITPLTRSQLIDLEGLAENYIDLLDPPQTGSPRAARQQSYIARGGVGVMDRSSAASTPSSRTTDEIGSSSSVLIRMSATARASEHPILRGEFFDVFEDPYTAHAWRLYDKMLYLLWWSYRPPSCTMCGTQDAWQPCRNSECRCAQCGAEAGSTRMNDIVEDAPGDGEHDVDDNSGDDELFGTADALVGGGESGSGGSTTITLYMSFYERLQRLLRYQHSVKVVVPTGEALPTTLRAALDMSELLALPGMGGRSVSVVQAAALYVSLALHRFAVPFPLFQLATIAPAPSRTPSASHTTKRYSDIGGQAEEMGGETQLQWVDVECLAALMGVSLADFFESPQVGAQYLQNALTVAASYQVPSILWHPARVAGRLEQMYGLRLKRHMNEHPTSGLPRSTGLSPEHTAMIVALELARRVDSEPMVACSSSPAAAAQSAARIGQWLDGMGLYPSRRVYRAECFFEGDRAAYEASLTTVAAVQDTALMSGGDPTAVLTTASSPWAGSFEWILPAPCANALLHVLSRTFGMTALELAELATRCGVYQGPSRFVEVLESCAVQGRYDVMPLMRRLTPVSSYWTSAYVALHSSDRLPFLAALHQLHDPANGTRDRLSALARLLQRILRKHQAASIYQFNYVLYVVDDSEKHFNGIYFLSAVYMDGSLATYTCLRSGRKTITYNAHTKQISLCFLNAKERLLQGELQAHFKGPVIATLESESAKAVMDAVVGGGVVSLEAWSHVVRRLDRCGRVRRRMRVPMLASRLDALASIRDASALLARHPIAGAATLAGWGQTESLMAAPPPVDVLRIRTELQLNFFSLPNASLLLGLSENRVVAMYASLVALLEFIHKHLQEAKAAATKERNQFSVGGEGQSSTWIEEILYDEDSTSGIGGPSSSPLSSPFGGGRPSPPQPSPPMRAVMTPVMGPRSAVSGVHITPTGDGGIMPSLPPLDLPMDANTYEQQLQPSSGECHLRDKAAPSSNADVTAFLSAKARKQKTLALRRREQQQLVQAHLRIGLPTYWEVLLGTATGSHLGSVSDRRRRQCRPSRGNSSRIGRARSSPAPLPMSVVSSGMHDEGVTGTPPHEAAVTQAPFNLFSAEECRRRLMRMFLFVASYNAKAEELQTLSDAGALQPISSWGPPPNSPQPLHASGAGGGASVTLPPKTNTATKRMPSNPLEQQLRTAGGGCGGRSPPGKVGHSPPRVMAENGSHPTHSLRVTTTPLPQTNTGAGNGVLLDGLELLPHATGGDHAAAEVLVDETDSDVASFAFASAHATAPTFEASRREKKSGRCRRRLEQRQHQQRTRQSSESDPNSGPEEEGHTAGVHNPHSIEASWGHGLSGSTCEVSNGMGSHVGSTGRRQTLQRGSSEEDEGSEPVRRPLRSQQHLLQRRRREPSTSASSTYSSR